MAFDARARNGLKCDINVTPLVDVMLVLLVIFMVITPLLRQRVPIELPIAAHGENARESAQITLKAAADGAIFLNEERVSDERLGERLGELYASRSDKTIYLEADRHLLYSRVVDLIDACRSAGVERIGVVIKKAGT